MATSAFKSTSKRGTTATTHNSTPKAPSVRKRSLSVSAIPRGKQPLDISSDFSNKRENPLFWTDKENTQNTESTTNNVVGTTGEDHRGRLVTRDSSSGVRNGIGRSLSRVRRRSVSRGHYGDYETEKEQDVVVLTNNRNTDFKQGASSVKTGNTVKNRAEIRGQIKRSQGSSSREATECSEDDSAYSFQISDWEDGVPLCSLSEAEKKTIKAVCKQMQGDHGDGDIPINGVYETVRSEVRRAISDIQSDIENAIQRNKVNAIATTNVADIPPDLVNPGAVELVLDIRREYARKLEESEERATKLREELAVEEHRGQELSRILKDILPDPKTSNPQKSHLARKRSSERKKMSKRLTEEAMAYFDECVSVSTFDSSDFSAPEDPNHYSAGCLIQAAGMMSTTQGNSSINLPLYAQDNGFHTRQTSGSNDQFMHSCVNSNLTANSSSCDPIVDQVAKNGGSNHQNQFSFAKKLEENFEPQNIKSYIKHFERGISVNKVGSDSTISNYDAGEYSLLGSVESLYFDKFFYNRVETGGMHLCLGSFAATFSPFGSVI